MINGQSKVRGRSLTAPVNIWAKPTSRLSNTATCCRCAMVLILPRSLARSRTIRLATRTHGAKCLRRVTQSGGQAAPIGMRQCERNMNAVIDKIANGRWRGLGCWTGQGLTNAPGSSRRPKAAKLETIRVLFADQHGVLRGKTIVASALASLFADGMAAPSTLLLKDTSHRTAFPVWEAGGDVAGDMRGAGDILMVPDPTSFRILPWSPHSAWVLCDLADGSGVDMAFCTRSILRRAVDKLAAGGMALVVGLEVEFHVFRVTDPRLDHAAGNDARPTGAHTEPCPRLPVPDRNKL
ncbi:Gamma-glutamylanilide synthase [Nymphon striatum]|nr:Gamma-glutamylanilide synthase [Nymphon striatum]